MLDSVQNSTLEILKTAGKIADNLQIEAYAVGGFVRDLFLKKVSKDLDIMVIGDGIEYAKILAKALNVDEIVEYPSFGTALIPRKEMLIEVASARTEIYDENSRKPEITYTDLKGDLARRDFTINAMAIAINGPDFGAFIDVYGGAKDLKNKILRTPLDAKETFSEDPLRMMRAVRFAAQLKFNIHDDALVAMKEIAPRISIISQERITEEFLKIFATDVPSIAFYLLQEVELLPLVFPEISVLGGVEDLDGQRHKDVFHHTLKVMDNVAKLSPIMRLRFAALVHDIGKPSTKKFIPGTGWSYHGHEEVGRRMLTVVSERMRLSRKLRVYLKKMTRLHLRPIALAQDGVSDSAIRRLVVEAEDYLPELMLLCRADVTSKNAAKIKKYYSNFDNVEKHITEVYEKDKLRAFQSPLRGDEIMALLGKEPSPLIGQIKKVIEEAILEGEIENDYESAKSYFFTIKDSFI
jgi:poly(A) polymerase